jgi:transglutaminase-like putative cysteine protease
MTDAGSNFFIWLYRRLSPGWQTWLLAGGLLVIAATSVHGAAWVRDSGPVGAGLFLGALCGAALAASRWRGLISLIYTLLLAPVLAVQAVGQVIPPLSVAFSLPALKLIELMNVRLFAFFERLNGWAALYNSGQAIPDTGLFVLLFALLAWLVGAWLSWCVRRWRQALAGILPLGLLLAVNVNLSGQDLTAVWLYVFVGLLLVARIAHNRQHEDWVRRRVDYPEDVGVDWTMPAFALALVITLFARLAPLVGTPQGWQTLSDLFKPAQQQVEDTAGRIFAQVSPPKVTATPLVHAVTPQLGTVGAPPAQGSDVVFYVYTGDPPPPPRETGIDPHRIVPQHYWRSGIFAIYTGSGWQPAPEDPAPFAPPPLSPTGEPAPSFLSEAAQGHYLLYQRFEIQATHGAQLFAASQPVEVSASTDGKPGPVLHRTRPDGSLLVYDSPGASFSEYTVRSYVPRPTAEQLNAAGTDYPPEIKAAYLQLPAELPQRVRNLAARLAATASTPYQTALAIQDYLRLTYTYDLKVKPPPPGRDVVDYFLYESRAGFCSYYATAMAVMLRTQGIPARVASGFANGEYDYDKDAYAVTVGDAHAWVEVYFSGLGWVEFEPTVSQATFVYAGGVAPNAPVAPEEPKPFSLPPGLTLALILFILAGGIGLLVLLLRFLGRGPAVAHAPSPALLAQAHYFTMRRALSLAGLRAPSSATPAEFLDQAAPLLARPGRQALAAALDQATALYQQAAYSPRPPAAEAVDSARRSWNEALGEWIRLAFSKRLNREGRKE